MELPPSFDQVLTRDASTSGSAALQKKVIAASANSTPQKLSSQNSSAKPSTPATAARRTIGMQRPCRSASQPHRLGASARMIGISASSTAISLAEKLSASR